MAEGGNGTAMPVDRQAVYRRSFQQKWHDLGFMKNTRDQLTVFEIVGGERGFILGKPAIYFVHPVPGIIYRLPFAQQLL